MPRKYNCRNCPASFEDLNSAIGHVIKEANEKHLDGTKPLGEFLEVVD